MRRRLLAIASLALLLSACAAISYARYRVAPDYPPDRTETLVIGGMQAPARIYLDTLGIPHIEASSEQDLLRAVGFAHGRDRFFQMDLMRRIAQGRVSELVGEQPLMARTTVDFDRTMAGWGLGEAARADAERESEPMRSLLAAYVEGVNAARERYPPMEYRLLGVDPEPWRAEDTFAIGRLDAWSISANWRSEISRLLIALWGGIDRSESIYPNDPSVHMASLPPLPVTSPLPPAIADELRAWFPERPPSPAGEDGAGVSLGLAQAWARAASNSWAMGGERTRSGKPMTANDPHLLLVAPAMFCQMHLKAPGLDAIGYTAPGLPYLIAGHNRDVSWGTTAALADVVDLFVERTDEQGRALGPAGWYPIEKREVVVRVRDGSAVKERRFLVRRTRHGPLLNDVEPALLPEWAPAVAIQWSLTDASGSIEALGRANRAKTVQELRKALEGMAGPIDAWTAADTTGSVALFVNGQVPRRRLRGTFPAPGWLAEYDWAGMVPASEMPFEVGSGGQVFIHANNPVRDPLHSEVLLGLDTGPSYRFERIQQLLAASPQHDAASFSATQGDVVSLQAQRCLPVLAEDVNGLQRAEPIEREAAALLERWNGTARADDAAPAIYYATLRELAIGALEDEVDARGLEYLLSDPFIAVWLDGWIASPDNPVWDDRRTPGTERRPDIVRAAFRRAVTALAGLQGIEPSGWSWGRLHEREIRHALGGVEALAGLVNLPREPAAGADETVAKSESDLGDFCHPFRPIAGPVIRMVVDLGDVDHGAWVLSTGASGWPASPHYQDQYPAWARGELLPMLFDWDEIRAQARAIITLR